MVPELNINPQFSNYERKLGLKYSVRFEQEEIGGVIVLLVMNKNINNNMNRSNVTSFSFTV